MWSFKHHEAQAGHLLRSRRALCGQAQGEICYEVVSDAEGCLCYIEEPRLFNTFILEL